MALSLLKKIIAAPMGRPLTSRDLIRRESELGRQLFGPIPAGHRREFFCLDRSTWIWYEEWQENGQPRSVTTRYEVRPNGILKVQDGQAHRYVQGQELQNLAQAVRRYYQTIGRQVYGRAV